MLKKLNLFSHSFGCSSSVLNWLYSNFTLFLWQLQFRDETCENPFWFFFSLLLCQQLKKKFPLKWNKVKPTVLKRSARCPFLWTTGHVLFHTLYRNGALFVSRQLFESCLMAGGRILAMVCWRTCVPSLGQQLQSLFFSELFCGRTLCWIDLPVAVKQCSCQLFK